jgi:N-acetylmuramoyl-L-alanine amidase
VKAAPPSCRTLAKFDDGDLVKSRRLGRHPQNTTRLVVDLDGVSNYSVYPLYGPYRLVIDFRRAVATVPVPTPPAAAPAVAVPPPMINETKAAATLSTLPQDQADGCRRPGAQRLRRSRPRPAIRRCRPRRRPRRRCLPSRRWRTPTASFSLSRQLGARRLARRHRRRHGGHDPGAQGNGIVEAELTLDVALRVQKLLEKEPGIEVVMTRDTDVFIPLEERTPSPIAKARTSSSRSTPTRAATRRRAASRPTSSTSR